MGGALPGHRPQLHVWLRSGAERWQRLPGPGWSASQHAERAAPLSHQENQQVFFSGPDQRRGPRVCSVMEAETNKRLADRFIPVSDVGMIQPSGNKTREVVSILGSKLQKSVNWQHVGCPFSYHFWHGNTIKEQTWRIKWEFKGWTLEHLCLKKVPRATPLGQRKGEETKRDNVTFFTKCFCLYMSPCVCLLDRVVKRVCVQAGRCMRSSFCMRRRTQRIKSLWATNQRQDLEIYVSYDGGTDALVILRATAMVLSSLALHFTSTGSAVCQLPALRRNS